MPTTSIAGVVPIVNLGPLTTTFTAPSSCVTELPFSAAGVAHDEDIGFHYPEGNCETGLHQTDAYPDCLPSGEKWRELAKGYSTGRYSQPYYSPGLQCPQGHITVGIAKVANATTSVSGILDPTFTSKEYISDGVVTTTTYWPIYPEPAYLFTSALGPGETAIVCCPSGYTAAVGLECYSTFSASELAGRTGCLSEGGERTTETWDYKGEPITNTYPDMWKSYDVTSTYTFDERGGPWFMPAATETVTPYSGPTDGFHLPRYQGVALQRFFWIVHGEADLEGAGVAGPSETGPSETGENAAASVAANVWRVAGALAAICGICSVASTGVLAC